VFRAVIDPGVLIAALISAKGAPRDLLHAWIDGEFELIISSKVLSELERVLARDKFRGYVSLRDAMTYVSLLRRFASIAPDIEPPPRSSPDPGDDYLMALASSQSADFLISGDPHLTGLEHPASLVLSPRAFLNRLTAGSNRSFSYGLIGLP